MEELIAQLIKRIEMIESRYVASISATWVSAETLDANLSVIRLPLANPITGTSTFRFVPKLASVTGLVAGQTIICYTNPLIIAGIQLGDIKKAS